MSHHPITPEPSTHEHPPRVQGAQVLEEVLPVYSDSVLISLSSPIDLPTLQCRRGLLYGETTACKASQNRGV